MKDKKKKNDFFYRISAICYFICLSLPIFLFFNSLEKNNWSFVFWLIISVGSINFVFENFQRKNLIGSEIKYILEKNIPLEEKFKELEYIVILYFQLWE